MKEALITINGHTLTDAQAMTVRNAIESFSGTLEQGLGDDEHGKRMVAMYTARIDEIRRMIFG